MREIKFRAWGPNSKYMWSWEELVANGIPITWLCGATDFHGERIIMQYTGLKAVNGEIYEGDIIKFPFSEQNNEWVLGEVRWTNGSFEIHDDFNVVTELLGDVAHISEIIGNIYENPELSKDDTI
jgi:uncharacterized phage protein (TIGR01671 family)